MSDWSWAIVDTQTGTLQAPVFPASSPWSRQLNTSTENRSSFAMLDDKNAALRKGNLSQPWRYTLVQSWQGKAVYAGVILDNDADLDAGTLSISHADIRTIFGRRTTLGANGYGGISGGRDEILNRTLDSIAAKVISDGMTGPQSNYPLPIDLPGPVTSVFSQTYWDWNFPFVDQILDDLQNYAAGPDMEFVPYWSTPNQLRWIFRSGYLGGPTLDFPMNVPKPPLSGVGVTTDARKQSTETYAVGKGSEADMKVAYAAVSSSTLPALVRVAQYKDIEDATQLQGQANGDLNAYKAPSVQFRASMMADGTPGIEKLALGQVLRLNFQDHWWMPDGWALVRLIGYSGDTSNKVSLQLQTTGAV